MMMSLVLFPQVLAATLATTALTAPVTTVPTEIPVSEQRRFWAGDGYWTRRHREKLREIAEGPGEYDCVFIGDSITHNWEGWSDPEDVTKVTQQYEKGVLKLPNAPGRAVWDELCGNYQLLNLGMGGDSTQHVLWRLTNGELDGYRTHFAMLMIGANNYESEDEVVAGVRACVNVIRAKHPEARVLLSPILPSHAEPDHPRRAFERRVNERIRLMADGMSVILVDFGDRLLEQDGKLSPATMPDYLHPCESGYRVWRDSIVRYLSAAAIERRTLKANILLPEVYAKGDVNLKPSSVTDGAAWIWGEGNANTQRFKCRFCSDGSPLTMHVSADNRYTLYVDGRRVGRGPDRGTVDHWTFRSYRVSLSPGEHAVEAVATFLGDAAPLAQLTAGTPGFLLRAEDPYDAVLTTGKGLWRAKPFANMTPIEAEVNAFGAGAPVRIDGDSAWTNFRDDNVRTTHVVRVAVDKGSGWGVAVGKWHLYPSSLPAQKDELKSPGRVVALVENAASNHIYAATDARHPAIAAFNRLLVDGVEMTLPSNTHWTVLWDLGNYYCAYPELDLVCGSGGCVKWAWAESLAHPRPAGPFGAFDKGNRGEFVGKVFTGYEDVYLTGGGTVGEGFQTPWWRCGRWCRLDIRTTDYPLTIRRLQIAETGYPIRPVAKFDCDDTSLGPIQDICVRGLQMNSHEMSFDCPYYEQQMYGGDSRIQFLTHHTLYADDRLVRRNIEILDESRRSDGRIGMNFPTRGTQESTSFSFMWPMMLADYAAWRTNRIWLAQRMPGLLHTMEGFHNFERGDGLLANLPGWNFIDWTTWPSDRAYYGEPKEVDRMSGILNLFYLYSLRSAAYVCDAMGEPEFAATYRRRFARTAAAYAKMFWCEKTRMLSDTDSMDSFSQHSQALAIVLGVLPPEKDAFVRKALVERADLVPATVSFKHYVFEALAKMGRGDLILKELDLWRSYVKKGLKTGQEMPDPTRSDCHGWSSHPLYALQAEIAGVTPAKPFFASVRVAPSPGALKFLRSATPTPKGEVVLDLRFDDGKATGTVMLPAGLSGSFEFGGRKVVLKPGRNEI